MADRLEPRIFLIGFNKCGTTSFHDFFKANGITSVHWRANTLAMTIHRHLQNNHWPLLDGLEQWTAYTDLVCIPGSPWGQSNSDGYPVIEACRYFKELHQSYPQSLFILNTRDPIDWVRSRLLHDSGQFASSYLRALAPEGVTNMDQLRMRWLQDWHEHHAKALRYFTENAPKQFLLFHISSTAHNELISFLKTQFTLPKPQFPHHHRTGTEP